MVVDETFWQRSRVFQANKGLVEEFQVGEFRVQVTKKLRYLKYGVHTTARGWGA